MMYKILRQVRILLEKLKEKFNFKLPTVNLKPTVNFKPNLKMGLVVGVLVLVMAVGYGGFKIYQESVKVIPEELLAETLEKTLAAQSYSYAVQLQMTTNGEERQLTDIEGVKANDSEFHIKGVMYGTDVEMYQFADSTYQKDPVNDKWMVFPTSVTDVELLVTEINPMSNFNFNQLTEVTYEGIHKEQDEKKYVLKCEPQVNNQFLELYWQNFQYTLWVDKNSKYITGAFITATNKDNPDNTLSLKMTLDNFNKEFILEKPE